MEIVNVAATLTAIASPVDKDRTDSACVYMHFTCFSFEN